MMSKAHRESIAGDLFHFIHDRAGVYFTLAKQAFQVRSTFHSSHGEDFRTFSFSPKSASARASGARNEINP